MADDSADDFFVEFDEFVAFGDADHSDYENGLDLLSLLEGNFELFGLPVFLDCVFELDEGGLLDGLIDVDVVDDFHEGHAVA